MTKGEYRVGVNFNPGGQSKVDGVKQITAGLIDEMEQIKKDNVLDHQEAARCANIAQQHYETAAMWAVKAITKPQEES